MEKEAMGLFQVDKTNMMIPLDNKNNLAKEVVHKDKGLTSNTHMQIQIERDSTLIIRERMVENIIITKEETQKTILVNSSGNKKRNLENIRNKIDRTHQDMANRNQVIPLTLENLLLKEKKNNIMTFMILIKVQKTKKLLLTYSWRIKEMIQ
jgi:hypothetical protein